MTTGDLRSQSIETLLARFEVLCIEQYHSIEREKYDIYNERFDNIQLIINELKHRSGDQRARLTKFYDHKNLQVALTAANANLAIDYASARKKIEEIANSDRFPQAGDAGMALLHLDRGLFPPT